MASNREESASFHSVQAERDLQANWEVDLAKKLEDYLLKICSGEITGDEDHSISVNFAEAALLLQGSVQVYRRKVEYLYNLVLHALDFLSQKRQQEHAEGSSAQPEQNDSNAGPSEDNDQFWVSDDIPVEARNCIDASTSKDASFYHFVKPPANLVVLEGDCLDNTGDSELESYLLASNDIYRDFILLDPCDAVTVNEFLKVDGSKNGQNSTYRGSSARKAFLSPSRRSGGSARKSVGKNPDADFSQHRVADSSNGVNDFKVNADHPVADGFGDDNHGSYMDDDHSEPMNFGDCNDLDDDDEEEEDDPWKPLNPHEPGNLKVKPFRKLKPNRKNALRSANPITAATLFPIAKLCGTISPELTEIWKERCSKSERNGNPPLYEKLRESLCGGGSYQHNDAFINAENDNEDDEFDNGIPDFGLPNEEMPDYMDEELPPQNEKHDGFDPNDPFGHEDPSSQETLEDLCRSHLDALLANIAETENQTELAARVSSWKHKIEHNLEEQDSRPPFDIHAYGETILEKLSVEEDSSNSMSFADIVKGQEKHDVARSFSALLQLVNNGDVSLERREENGNPICFTATNPFYVQLLNNEKRQNKMQFRFSKKRVKSPTMKGYKRDPGGDSGYKLPASQPSCKLSAKTPDGKRRRRSRFVEPLDLHSSQ